jgi:hypothetical protein
LLTHVLKLLKARKQEEELSLKSVAGRIAIEVVQEGILFMLFQHQARAEAVGDDARQAGLAYADGPFNGQKVNVLKRQTASPTNLL